MAFTSPYGIGYGLGAIGSGISGGLLRGQEMAPQLRYENLRNQMLQTQLGNEQAQQQAFSQTNPTQIAPSQQTTPLDQPVSNLQFYIQQLRQNGQGLKANELEQNMAELQQKQRNMAVGRAAQEILYGDPNNAKSIMNNLGFNIDSIEQSPDGNFNIKAGGQTHNLSPDEITMIAADPSQLPNIFYRKQMLGLRGQAIQQRREANWNNYQARLQAIEASKENTQTRTQAQLQSAQTAAGGRVGAARVAAAGALERAKLKPDVAANGFMQEQLGMTPDESNAALEQAKQNPKSLDQIVQNAQKAHPEWEANDVIQFRQSLQAGIGGRVAAPAPRRAAPKAPAAVPLPQDRTKLRSGVVYATPKGNLRFNGTGFEPI